MTFEELKLHPDILRAIQDKGYETPTAIQEKAIPVILEGRDVIGSAPTGTGKTAAFALPTLSRLGSHKGTRALVLAPTRELVVQCEENFKEYGVHTDLKLALLYGGVGYQKQLDDLAADPDVVIATPGRLLDHMEQKRVHFDKLEVLILDEVDRMLDMGFIEDVRRIIKKCPQTRQTLFFSATMPDTIQRLADWALTDPEIIDAGQRRSPAKTIEHSIYPIDAMQKSDLLVALLKSIEFESVIVFTKTKRDADRVSDWLMGHDLSVSVMHADRSQKERQQALKGFKEGKYSILVATDVASRGLDVNGISHVINFNVPQHAEDYVHRIGRTGRADTEGEAFTLFSGDEHAYLIAIERYIDQEIQRKKLEGFAYRREPDLGQWSPKKPTASRGGLQRGGMRRGGFRR